MLTQAEVQGNIAMANEIVRKRDLDNAGEFRGFGACSVAVVRHRWLFSNIIQTIYTCTVRLNSCLLFKVAQINAAVDSGDLSKLLKTLLNDKAKPK